MYKGHSLIKLQSITLVMLCLMVACFIIAFPHQSFQAALTGLDTWLRSVFPALLPFFITSEIMMGIGLVDFFAVLLRPIMKPLFRCPGESSFIWAMSITSGYPVGAKLTSSFLERGNITVQQAQRIIAFCSTSGPLFMLGAVGIGMLNNPTAGKVIALSHYAASIIVGLIFRFYMPSDHKEAKKIENPPGVIKTAFAALLSARKKDNRTFGEMLSDAVRNSMNALLYIGGFIILFSVIIDILLKTGLISNISHILAPIFIPLGISPQLLPGLMGGILEMTTGCKLIAQAAAPVSQKIILSTFIISWSGFSIHCQVMGFLSKSNISMGLYIIAKVLHGILASILAWTIMKIWRHPDLDVFHQFTSEVEMSFSAQIQNAWQLVIYSLLILSAAAIMCLTMMRLNPSRGPKRL